MNHEVIKFNVVFLFGNIPSTCYIISFIIFFFVIRWSQSKLLPVDHTWILNKTLQRNWFSLFVNIFNSLKFIIHCVKGKILQRTILHWWSLSISTPFLSLPPSWSISLVAHAVLLLFFLYILYTHFSFYWII